MGHSHCAHLYHIVYSTKYRHPWLTPGLAARVHAYLGATINGLKGSVVIVNGYHDHVHMLAWLPQDRAVSGIVGAVKARSSGWLHRTHPELAEFAWQTGYGSFTVCRSHLQRIKRYIEHQEEHHRRQSFQDEYLALLDEHQVPYDPETMWD